MSTYHPAMPATDTFVGENILAPSSDAPSPVRFRRRNGAPANSYKIFHYVLLVYIFLYISRLSEFLPFLRFSLILQPIMLVGLFLTNQVRTLLTSRSGKWLIALTVWIGVCVPFSYWPGGSFWIFVRAAQALLLVAFMAAFVHTMGDVRRAMYAVGLAAGTIAIISFLSSGGGGVSDRLGLAGTATLGDANFFALYLLVGLAFLCLAVTQARGLLRLVSGLLIPIVLTAFGRTGSRAGLLAFVVGLVMFFAFGTMRQRLAVFVFCIVGVILAAFLVPQNIKARFTTYFDSQQRTTELKGAVASSQARLYLLRHSIELTARHPLLGVGPDMFIVAENEQSATEGVRGAWQYTHNTYTQMSSELGLPGLILFAGAMFGGYRGLSAIRKRGPTWRIRQTAMFLQMGYMMLMVGAFFLSLGYGGLPYIVVGLSITLRLAVRRFAHDARMRALQPEAALAV